MPSTNIDPFHFKIVGSFLNWFLFSISVCIPQTGKENIHSHFIHSLISCFNQTRLKQTWMNEQTELKLLDRMVGREANCGFDWNATLLDFLSSMCPPCLGLYFVQEVVYGAHVSLLEEIKIGETFFSYCWELTNRSWISNRHHQRYLSDSSCQYFHIPHIFSVWKCVIFKKPGFIFDIFCEFIQIVDLLCNWDSCSI